MSSKPTKANKKKSGGQPKNDNAKKWKSAKKLEKAINAYFESIDNHNNNSVDEDGKIIYFRPYTMSGLALALDIDRKTLVNYSKDDSFSTLIKKAKARVEEQNEEMLTTGRSAAGIIFNLKNNFGWEDKQEKKIDLGLTVEDYFKDNPLNA